LKNISSNVKNFAAKFELLFQTLKTLISQEGKEIVFINVEAEHTPKEQFAKYLQTVEFARDKVEFVVDSISEKKSKRNIFFFFFFLF